MANNQDNNKSILIVDDEPSICEMLEIILQNDGFQTRSCHCVKDAMAAYKAQPADIVLHDLNMPDEDGFDLLKAIRAHDAHAICIVMTAFNTWENALESMRLGAYDYIQKPFENNTLKGMLNQAIQLKYTFADKSADGTLPPSIKLHGNSSQMQAVLQTVNTIAKTDTLVLIRGESGVGKDLVARQIHYQSYRTQHPFVAVNCGALTETLLESELFGHTKGAFTGAISERMGLLESAGKGTVFLDEIGDISLQTQTKLLRVLENRSFFPVGSTQERRVEARIVAATNRPLEEMIEQKLFRADLFYRLNIIPIQLPPLRERADDIVMLTGTFIERYARELNKNISGISDSAVNAIRAHNWPGNIRELQNVIQRAVALCTDKELQRHDINLGDQPLNQLAPTTETPTATLGESFNLEEHLAMIERKFIKQALEESNHNLTEAAKRLGMTFRSIRYKVKKLGIDK